MEFAIFWFIFSALCGVMASKAGRSGFGYFILACLISPIICFLLLAILGKVKEEGPSPETHIRCPDCAEYILKEAKVCKHCGCKLVPQ